MTGLAPLHPSDARRSDRTLGGQSKYLFASIRVHSRLKFSDFGARISDLESVSIGRPSFGCLLPFTGSAVKKFVPIREIRVSARQHFGFRGIRISDLASVFICG
jgi:hypothetical protein